MNSSFQIVLGVFVDLIAAPFCYEGCSALMNRQWLRAIIAYLVGIPLALVGLSIVGIIPASYTSWVIPIVQPIALAPAGGCWPYCSCCYGLADHDS